MTASTLAPADPRHGTANGYVHLGCRCDSCRAANTRRCASQCARRVPEDAPHGTTGGYSNYGCRCAPCTEANSVRCAKYKAQRRERAVSAHRAADQPRTRPRPPAAGNDPPTHPPDGRPPGSPTQPPPPGKPKP